MNLRARILFAAACGTALAALLLAFGTGGEDALQYVWFALGLGCFAIVAELLEHNMQHGGHASIALIPFFAITLVAPSWVGIWVVGATELVVQIIRRRPLTKIVYNTAQAVVAVSFSILAYRQLGGQSFALPGTFFATLTRNAVPALAALVLASVVNSAMVSAIIAAVSESRFLEVWRRNTLGTAAYSLLTWPFACGLAYVLAQHGMVGALALSIPMLGVRELYRTTLQLQRTSRELLEMMVKAIEARDPYTSGHSRRVSHSATVIARSLGLKASQIERVRIAGLLHDLGKIHEDFAPILRKESSLTKDEWDIMKTHSDKGADLVATLSDLRDLVAPIRHHHENWDGTGYPAGIAGEMIPLASRIIAFADTIDALTTERPYRKAFGQAEVRAELVRCRGAQFDPKICDVVLSQSTWAELFQRNSGPQLRIVADSPPRKAVGA